MIDFFENLRNATSDKDSDLLSVPGGVFFGGDEKLNYLHSKLYIRKCYVHLCDLIFNLAIIGPVKRKGALRKKSFVLQGNPGIGKSMFSFYLMYRLMLLGKTIVWQPARTKRRVLISPPNSISPEITVQFSTSSNDFSAQLHLLDTWFIVDADVPENYNAFTVLISSPKKEIVHEFKKVSTVLFMPVWSLYEIRRAHGLGLKYACIDGKAMTLEEAERHFKIFGGIPRYVFESGTDLERWKTELDSAITNADFTKFQQAIGEVGNPNGGPVSISHMVVQIIVNTKRGRGRYRSFQLKFASKYVEEKFMLQLLGWQESELLRFMHATILLPAFRSICGTVFEGLVHRRISKGGPFDIGKLHKDATPSDVKAITLEPSESTDFKKLVDLKVPPKRLYWKPKRRNFPGIDSLMYPDMLFQMTVSMKHSVKKTAIVRAAKTLRDLQMKSQGQCNSPCVIRLLFVVPQIMFNDYREQNLLNGDDTVAASAIDGRILRVEQYVMGVSLAVP